MVERVVATGSALALIDRLRQQYGPLMFQHSGEAREGSAARCLPRDGRTVGAGLLLWGEVGGCPFYIGRSHHPLWRRAQLIVDVAEADGHGLVAGEGPDGVSFLARARLLSTEEWAALSVEAPH